MWCLVVDIVVVLDDFDFVLLLRYGNVVRVRIDNGLGEVALDDSDGGDCSCVIVGHPSWYSVLKELDSVRRVGVRHRAKVVGYLE